MATVANRLIELFRNLKSDAVPNPPRPTNEESSTNSESQDPPPQPSETAPDVDPTKQKEDGDDYEEIVYGADDFVKDEKPSKFSFPFKSKKSKGDDPKDPRDFKPKHKKGQGSYSSVNTQATGSVFNVVNSSGVQFGSNHVYYMSSGTKVHKKNVDDDVEHIEKDNLITLLMESTIQPTHKYIDFVSKNLGLNWKSLFVSMGYIKGRIETLVLEKGITEARYFMLLEWVQNEDDATLGKMACLLWEEGEREIVKQLSLIYKENKK